MRVIEIGSKKYTTVICLDNPGAGGACHEYEVITVTPIGDAVFASVSFQNGPIKENGVNGCHQEDLLSIVIDRLQCFQKGEFACRENAIELTKIKEVLIIALTKIEEALMWLRK